VFYLYVVDARRHLVGVTSLRRLLLVSPETPLKRIMTADVTSVRVDTDQEEVARQVASYNLLAVPVVDEENKLVGVVTVDDVIDVIKDEATEDLYRLATSASPRRPEKPSASACRGSESTWSRRSWQPRWSHCLKARFSRLPRSPSSCRSWPGWAATPPPRRSP
jgi:magnesium transporter